MKQQMRYWFVLALAVTSTGVSACGDDDDDVIGGNGGTAGAAGTKTGGSSSGGGKAGASTGGKAGSGGGGKAGASTGGSAGSTTGGTEVGGASGAGGAGDGGTAGATEGGAAGSDGLGGSGGDGGAGEGGAGGAGEPALVYACGSATLIQKQCSALAAANCVEGLVCADCVNDTTTARQDFQTDPPCDTCNAKWDAFAQCEVDAFESGDLAFGVECVEDYGADGSANCYPFLDEAIACEGYVGSDVNPHDCPATWPPQ